MLYTYNDIVMKMVKTNNIQFDAVLTEDGATYLYTHYTIDIQAIVNPSTMSYLGGAGDGDIIQTLGTFPATTVRAIRHALLQPRKFLSITDELGNEMLATPDLDPVSGGRFTVDAKTGPSPISCSIVNISGARTLTIRWVCEGWISECPIIEDLYILSNRWSDQMVVNSYQMTTRTFSGHTIFNKSLLVRANLLPDDFRNKPIFPNVAAGFQRKNVEIVQNSEGTELVWRVIDEERVWVLRDTTPDFSPTLGEGSGILEVDGVQSVQAFRKGDSNSPLLGATINTIQLRAKGSYYANQWLMLQRLIEIISTLTPETMSSGTAPEKGYFILDSNMSRSLGQKEKWVEISTSIWCAAPESTDKVTAPLNLEPIAGTGRTDIREAVNKVIDQSTKVSPPLIEDNGTRGSSTVRLLTEMLLDSCQDQPDQPTIDYLINSGPPNQPNNDSQESRIPSRGPTLIPNVPTNYDQQSPGRFPYTVYHIEPRFVNKTGIKQIPTTGPVSDQGNSNQPIFGGLPGQSSNPTCGLVQVHMPISRVFYEGYAERVGAFPTMPSPVANNTDQFVLLNWEISPMFPVPSFDGVTPVYRCDFRFEYAVVVGGNASNPVFALGRLPFSLFGNEIHGSLDFSNGILGI